MTFKLEKNKPFLVIILHNRNYQIYIKMYVHLVIIILTNILV